MLKSGGLGSSFDIIDFVVKHVDLLLDLIKLLGNFLLFGPVLVELRVDQSQFLHVWKSFLEDFDFNNEFPFLLAGHVVTSFILFLLLLDRSLDVILILIVSGNFFQDRLLLILSGTLSIFDLIQLREKFVLLFSELFDVTEV